MKFFYFVVIAIALVLTNCKQSVVEPVEDNIQAGDFIMSDVQVSERKNVATADRWLFMVYLAADNDLTEYLWSDLNEMEYGLYRMNGAVSADVFVFWDGIKNSSQSGYAPTGTHVYKLGSDGRLHSTNSSFYNVDDPYLKIASTTEDLTAKASFISNGEVDSSDSGVLRSFLKLVKDTTDGTSYDKTVLILSDHGSGPGEVTDTESRAMFQDMTTDLCGSALMTSQDCAKAIADAGYSGDHKLDLLFFDLCLAGSIEDAYAFRDTADYMLASPDITYADGFNYMTVLSDISAGMDICEFSSAVIETYRSDYAWSNDVWRIQLDSYKVALVKDKANLSQFVDILKRQSNDSSLTDEFTEQLEAINSRYEDVCSWNINDYQVRSNNAAMSLYSLGAVDDLATMFNGFADTLLTCSEAEQQTLKELLWKYDDRHVPNTLFYQGTYAYLYDIGWYAERVAQYAETAGKTELKTKASAVREALKNVIVYAWRDGFVYKDNTGTARSEILSDIPYGMTVCGEKAVESTVYNGMVIYKTTVPISYTKQYIPFVAANPKWAAVLDTWFSGGDIYK